MKGRRLRSRFPLGTPGRPQLCFRLFPHGTLPTTARHSSTRTLPLSRSLDLSAHSHACVKAPGEQAAAAKMPIICGVRQDHLRLIVTGQRVPPAPTPRLGAAAGRPNATLLLPAEPRLWTLAAEVRGQGSAEGQALLGFPS